MNYLELVEMTRSQRDAILSKMRAKTALEFMATVNHPNADLSGALKRLQIEELALGRVEEILDLVLESMEKGE